MPFQKKTDLWWKEDAPAHVYEIMRHLQMALVATVRKDPGALLQTMTEINARSLEAAKALWKAPVKQVDTGDTIARNTSRLRKHWKKGAR